MNNDTFVSSFTTLVLFFFLAFCVFRETFYTIDGHAYLVIDVNVKAFKDTALV